MINAHFAVIGTQENDIFVMKLWNFGKRWTSLPELTVSSKIT